MIPCVCHLYIIFDEFQIFQSFLHCLALLLSFKHPLDILDTNSVTLDALQMWFVFLPLPLEEKSLILMKSSLPLSSFMTHAFAEISSKYWPGLWLKRFSSGNFTILSFIFQCMIGFEEIFTCGLRYTLKDFKIFLYQVFQQNLLKNCPMN